MALPTVIFNAKTSAAARSEAIKQLRHWVDSSDVSAVKRQTMHVILNYAAKNLVQPFSHIEPSYFSICNAIFKHANLPDLLFLQYVSNQMATIQDETSDLKRAVLPVVQCYKRPLALPLVKQMEQATLGFNLAALLISGTDLILLAAARFFTSAMTAESKIEWFLNNWLTLKTTVPCFDAGLETVPYRRMTAVGFFNRKLHGPKTEQQPILAGPSKQFTS